MIIRVSDILPRGVRIALIGDDGVEVNRRETKSSCPADRDRKAWAKAFGVDAAHIDAALARHVARDAGTTATDYVIPAEPVATPGDGTSAPPIRFLMRPREGRGVTEFATLDDAIGVAATVEHVIEWDRGRIGEVCAVDFDWHGVAAPPRAKLESVAYNVRPAPRFAWITKSGGLRLIYIAPRDADAIGAVAAVAAQRRLGGHAAPLVELITRTRHPGDEAVIRRDADTTLTVVAEHLAGEVGDERRDEYLAERGWHLDLRLPHTECPIAPKRPSSSPDPVHVQASGVYCHSCGARGRGLTSYAELIGIAEPTRIIELVRGFIHYEQAELELPEFMPDGIRGEVLAAWYRAHLSAHYGPDDPRVAAAFQVRDLFRFPGYWGTRTGASMTKIERQVEQLPAVRDAENRVIPAKHEKFLNPISLTDYGYRAIRRIIGAKIGTHHHPPKDRDPRIVVPLPDVPAPQYLPTAERLDESDAWRIIETVYPDIDRQIIELLVYCRGIVERGEATTPPMFMFNGVSSSGKTSHVVLAAAFCGDHATIFSPSGDEERVGEQLHRAVSAGSFAIADEVTKLAKNLRRDLVSYLTFLLSLTPDKIVRLNYIGQIPLGATPIIAITDTHFDDDLKGSMQFGRRIYERDMGNRQLKWHITTPAAGISPFWNMRSGGDDLRRAADSLVSIWIDRYFLNATPSIGVVASRLDCRLLMECGAATAKREQMREFFEAWYSYDPPRGPRYTRGVRPGYKAFEAMNNTLADKWAVLHDPGDPYSWRFMNDQPWDVATGRDLPLRMDVHPVPGAAGMVQVTFSEQVTDPDTKLKTWRTVT